MASEDLCLAPPPSCAATEASTRPRPRACPGSSVRAACAEESGGEDSILPRADSASALHSLVSTGQAAASPRAVSHFTFALSPGKGPQPSLDRLPSFLVYPEAHTTSDVSEAAAPSVQENVARASRVVSPPQTLSSCRLVYDAASARPHTSRPARGLGTSPQTPEESPLRLPDSGRRLPVSSQACDGPVKMGNPDGTSETTDQANCVNCVTGRGPGGVTSTPQTAQGQFVSPAPPPSPEQVERFPLDAEVTPKYPQLGLVSGPHPGMIGSGWQQRRRVSRKKEGSQKPATRGMSQARATTPIQMVDKSGNDDSDQKGARDVPSHGPASSHDAAALPSTLGVSCPFEVPLAEVFMQGVIGKGATSSVYRAEWRGSPVACKIVSLPVGGSAASRAPQIRQVIQDFRQELGVMSRLKHRNLVGLKGAGTRNPPLFMLTELCAGGSLFDLLHKGVKKVNPAEEATAEEGTPSSTGTQPASSLQDPKDEPYRAAVASMLECLTSQASPGANEHAAPSEDAGGGFWAFLGRLAPFAAKKETSPAQRPFRAPGASTAPSSHGTEDILFSRGSAVPLSWKLRAQIALDLAEGCRYLHSVNLVHRDIKSLNVLLTEANVDGVNADEKPLAKLADFGCTVLTPGGLGAVGGTTGGPSVPAAGWAGTVLWMAPEVLAKQGCTDKSDVYSFAIVLYELLSNRIPFQELQGTPAYERLPELIPCGLRPNISSNALPRDLPQGLRNLMESCWRKDPANRPPFTHIVKALEIIIEEL